MGKSVPYINARLKKNQYFNGSHDREKWYI